MLSVKALHRILINGSETYAASKTPFFEAEYFKPNHFQPWISADHIRISTRMPVDTVVLKREEVADWLSSYSFAPKGEAFDLIVEALLSQWFDQFNQSGLLSIPYVGFVAAGPLRETAFDTGKMEDPIPVDDPLLSNSK